MIIAIPFSHRDGANAVRLLRWIGFLSEKNHRDMRRERLLLVPSRGVAGRIWHKEAVYEAMRIFGKAFCFVPETEDERGWPASCNFMFRQALIHVEQHFQDDMFLIEPDAVPCCADWFQQFKTEYYEGAVPAGKIFMGGYVTHGNDHMTGNAIYGKNWRTVAPRLVEANSEAWDTYSSDQVKPHARFTRKIQHIFHNPSIHDVTILAAETLLFHQDKRGSLIRLLDEARFGGSLYAGSYDIVNIPPFMSKFYHTQNASRTVVAYGETMSFMGYEYFGGAWMGVFEAKTDQEIFALDKMARDPASGITEITEVEYAAALKKKGHHHSPASSLPPPKSPLMARVDDKAGRVVAGDSAEALPGVIPQSPAPLPNSIEEVLEVGAVKPPDQPAVEKVKRPRAKASKN